MTLVLDRFRSLLPKIKTSPSGWISFNAPCCQHRGHARDTRKRAGIMFSEGVVYNCFNCKYTASWQPGRTLTEKFKTLCRWLGANDDEIKHLVFEALKTESLDYEPEHFVEKVKFTKKDLPEATMTIAEWVNSAYLPDIAEDIGLVIDYIISRGYDPMDDNFCWSPAPGFIDRVIIPFKYDGVVVGNTARKVKDGKPKYLSEQQPGFVFNLDQQTANRKCVIVLEGPMDAISIGGVAITGSEVNKTQRLLINQLQKQVIVVPDRDTSGKKLIEQAVDFGWSVSMPEWAEGIKDVNDAIRHYGRIYTLWSIIKSTESMPLKIQLKLKSWLRTEQ